MPETPPPIPGNPPNPGPPAHPDLSRPPAATPTPTPTPTIYMTPEQYAAQQAEIQRLQGIESAVKAQLAEADQQRLKALAEKGQIEEALAQNRKIWEDTAAKERAEKVQTETAWFAEKTSSAIAQALNGRAFTGPDPAATAAILRRMLEAEIETVRDPQGTPLTRSRSDLRPAADYLRARLESPELAFFFAPSSRGGSGSDGTRPPTPPQAPAMPLPPEQQIKAWQASNGTRGFGLAPAPK